MNITERMAHLRKEMKQKEYDAYIVPSSDPHQSEYVAERWKARAWITGFTGSAGTAVFTADSAGLWTDGRYFLQAEKELAGSGITLFKMGMPDTPTYQDWLKKELSEGDTVSFDADVLSVEQAQKLSRTLAAGGMKTVHGEDIIDIIWEDRPPIPRNNAVAHPVSLAGKSRTEKIGDLRKKMRELSADYLVLSSLDDIAWLFNIRGSDVKCNPVVVSFALISVDDVYLCIDDDKILPDLKQVLADDGIVIRPYGSVKSVLGAVQSGESILMDPKRVSVSLRDAVDDAARIIEKTNPTTHMKASKNSVEIMGMKNAHVRDGVAMVKFLRWLETSVGNERVTELDAAEKLAAFREQNDRHVGPSFDTISGYGPNGAIIHYSVTPESDTELRPDNLYLVDSGGQYTDGTTDITRTVALGTPDTDMKKHYTLVLQGHINLAQLIFHRGMATGTHIEAVARLPLWKNGLNFNHGTGHGVGAYLNVHEGPQSISPRWNDVKLAPGMIMSNEPGYYKEGAYGIRIENLILTTEHAETDYGHFLAFETITFCPLDTSLIDVSMLDDQQLQWVNDYHAAVRETLSPHLDGVHTQWLAEKTAELRR